jgi:hypothetical protein
MLPVMFTVTFTVPQLFQSRQLINVVDPRSLAISSNTEVLIDPTISSVVNDRDLN